MSSYTSTSNRSLEARVLLRRAATLSLLLSALACQTHTGGAKGGLVPVKVEERDLDGVYAPRRFALLIGISRFEDEAWRPLRYPGRDVADLSATLRDPQRGRYQSVVELTRPEQTRRARVLEALRALKRVASRPDDIVVVYVSAHGTLARDSRGVLQRYLVTSDASMRDVAQTALSMDALKLAFEEIPARRRALFLATCHSGSGKSLLPAEVEQELAGIKSGFYARPLEESSRASMVFSASDWGETAREDDGLGHDVYTHFLLVGLSGEADRNGDGAVSAVEAHDFARRRTYAFTRGRQRPSAEIMEVGADPIILSGQIRRTGRPELYSYQPRLDGFTLKVDGEERAELPGAAAVTPGRRTVELTKGGEVLLRRELDVSLGERIDLTSLVEASEPHRTLALLGGIFGFIDSKSRSQLLPNQMTGALALRFDGLLSRKVSLALDFAFSAGRDSIAPTAGQSVPLRFTNYSWGVSTPFALLQGPVSVSLGPRVAALFLRRSFDLETYRKDQDYFTVTPGLALAASYAITRELEFSAQGHLMGTYVMVDGSGQVLGFAGAWAGLGYRF